MESPRLRWAILACGKVSHDFVQALKLLPTQQVVAVGARKHEDAQAFVAKHCDGAQAFGSYADAAACDTVDAVYIGTLHPWHREHAEMALRCGKHVLVEKPIAMNRADAAAIYAAGAAAGKLVLEGMWTRFFPAVKQTRELLASGTIGTLAEVKGSFGVDAASDIGTYPSDTVFQQPLGGGAVTLLGPYLVQAALLGFRLPSAFEAVDVSDGELDAHRLLGSGCRLAAAGIVDAPPPNGGGAELTGAATIVFPPRDAAAAAGGSGGPGGGRAFAGLGAGGGGAGGVAVLSCSLIAESAEEVCFVGSKGSLTLRPPAHCPTALTLRLKGDGRGAAAEVRELVEPLPEEPALVVERGGFIMPNSIGFAYEAAGFASAVAAGLLECAEWTHAESLACLELLDEWRKQVVAK